MCIRIVLRLKKGESGAILEFAMSYDFVIENKCFKERDGLF